MSDIGEKCAFQTIGAQYLRDVSPGEMVSISPKGLTSTQLTPARPAFDVFEFVYFARPDSVLLGKSVYEVRKIFGARLAREFPLGIDKERGSEFVKYS